LSINIIVIGDPGGDLGLITHQWWDLLFKNQDTPDGLVLLFTVAFLQFFALALAAAA